MELGCVEGRPERGESAAVRYRKRWAIAITVGFVLLVGSAVVVDRGSVALLGFSPFEFLRPSIADVLDGRTANSERLAAIGEVTSGSRDLLTFRGIETVGEQIYTMCDEGQNNWWVQDGYRLSCWAQSYRFIAWDGDFDTGRSQVMGALTERGCVPDSQTVNIDRGKPTTSRWEEQWPPLHCGDDGRITLFFEWADARRLRSSEDLHRIGEIFDQDDVRNVSVPAAEPVITRLGEFDWFALVYTTRDFYRDSP